MLLQTKTKTEKDTTCAMFSKGRRFEDIKYDTEREFCNKVRKSAESANSAESAQSTESMKSAKSAGSAKSQKVSGAT